MVATALVPSPLVATPPAMVATLTPPPSPAGLYYVDSEGTRVPGAAFAVGSGATYAYGVLDRGGGAGLEEGPACELARRAIFQAARRDAYSGGRVTVYAVGPGGWRRVSSDNLADLQERYGAGEGPA